VSRGILNRNWQRYWEDDCHHSLIILVICHREADIGGGKLTQTLDTGPSSVEPIVRTRGSIRITVDFSISLLVVSCE